MAKNAILFGLKAAHRYHVDRPCHGILADGAAAGITAAKNSGCGVQLISNFSPDGGGVIADWKTAPFPATRKTDYSGNSDGAASLISFSWIETPRMLMYMDEGAGPIEGFGCHSFGEVIVGLDSALGESATYGHSDGRTVHGSLVSRHVATSSSGHLGYNNANQQSMVFYGAEATKRRVFASYASMAGGNPENMATAAMMVPAGYGTGDFSFRGGLLMTSMSSTTFHVGYPAWLTMVKQGAHWSPITLSGVATKRLGSSTTTSAWALTPHRKDGAAADTIYFGRVVGAWANWPDLLQAVFDEWTANLTYWEVLGSA